MARKTTLRTELIFDFGCSESNSVLLFRSANNSGSINGSSEVERGVQQANQAGTPLEQILSAAREVNQQVTQIASAAEQMNGLSNELVAAMDVVSAVVEENTAATEEMAAGSSEMTQAIENIANLDPCPVILLDLQRLLTNEENSSLPPA